MRAVGAKKSRPPPKHCCLQPIQSLPAESTQSSRRMALRWSTTIRPRGQGSGLSNVGPRLLRQPTPPCEVGGCRCFFRRNLLFQARKVAPQGVEAVIPHPPRWLNWRPDVPWPLVYPAAIMAAMQGLNQTSGESIAPPRGVAWMRSVAAPGPLSPVDSS